MKNVLVLGAGLVSRPLVEYLLKKDYNVRIASRTVSKAEALVQGYTNGAALTLNINNQEQLDDLISQSDITISLVPYTYHVQIAELCIKHKKHLVTTSYVSPAMKALHDQAFESGICILNEIGLDPGIDHMSAMQIIDNVKHKNGKVVSFKSYCGGLPSLASNNRPLGYKFSWSPRGVVMAGKNTGQYLENDKVIFIPGNDLFKHYNIIDIDGFGSLEAYTNRDALPYKELYGLNDAHTIFRGTLRNIGWCYTMKKVHDLGLFNNESRSDLKNLTYHDLMLKLIDLDESFDIIDDTAYYLGIERHSTVIKHLEWLGLFSDKKIPTGNNVMDVFCELLQDKLSMEQNDLDLIVLYHQFIAEYEDKTELITSTLIDSGIPGGDSAMSRTVSLPAAIAAAMLLREEIKVRGVHIPVQPEIYNPVLEELGHLGVNFSEKTYPIT
jgi:saccharopine dehydrogenase-like NADP-dependent oxidoreductase